MKYITYIKDFTLAILIILLLTLVRNLRSDLDEIKDLAESNKNNLYQTNEVVANMQQTLSIDK
tara:strand:- start:317 stop:505 length:189 start_codon:yes stop_codon:yes gene_type:complete